MVAIKDMEMPKSCWNCNFCCAKVNHYKVDYYCAISENELAREVADMTSENRPTDCPLTEIITCKDCKHCYHMTDAPKVLVCEKHNCQQVSKNFFCADGERRE